MANYQPYKPEVGDVDYPVKISQLVDAVEAIATDVELGRDIHASLDFRFDDAEGRLDVIEAALLTVDAVTLDSLDSSQFVRSDIADVIAGNHEFYSTDIAGHYTNAAIELREANLVGAAQSIAAYAPALTFHWGGRVQQQIALHSDNTIVFRDGSTHAIDCAIRTGTIYESGTSLSAKYSSITHTHDTLYLGITDTAANSNLLDNYNTSLSSAASTIPVRDASADISARLFRSNYAEQTTAPATTADICFRNDTTDSYMRFMSNTAFSTWCQNALIKTYDSARLGGQLPSVSAGNNTIVQRHSSGYIYANYFNTTATATATLPSNVMVETGSDNFIRKQSMANFLTNLGIEDYDSSHTFAATGQQTFSNGFSIKWGTYNHNYAIVNVTFVSAFTTACTAVFNQNISATATTPRITAKSTTGFTSSHTNDGSTYYYFAIGY